MKKSQSSALSSSRSGPADDLGAWARVVELQFAGSEAVLLDDPIREDPAERQAGARHDDAHVERRAWGRVRGARGDRLVRSRSEHDEHYEAGEQRQRDNDQRCLPG